MNTLLQAGKSIPEDLRKALKALLTVGDYDVISAKDGAMSHTTVRNMINGFELTESSVKTAQIVVDYAFAKAKKKKEQFAVAEANLEKAVA